MVKQNKISLLIEGDLVVNECRVVILLRVTKFQSQGVLLKSLNHLMHQDQIVPRKKKTIDCHQLQHHRKLMKTNHPQSHLSKGLNPLQMPLTLYLQQPPLHLVTNQIWKMELPFMSSMITIKSEKTSTLRGTFSLSISNILNNVWKAFLNMKTLTFQSTVMPKFLTGC